MSKITPKNLSYDTTLPPFLARLQSQNASNDGRQDYHAARPKKPRDEDADREDEPVYFDEASGETLTKAEWEEREKFEGGEKATGVVSEVDGEGKQESRESKDSKEKDKEREKLAAIGAGRKRKAGKVVGGDDESDKEVTAKKLPTDKKASATKLQEKGAEKGSKVAKKGKKIKLSFGDDE